MEIYIKDHTGATVHTFADLPDPPPQYQVNDYTLHLRLARVHCALRNTIYPSAPHSAEDSAGRKIYSLTCPWCGSTLP